MDTSDSKYLKELRIALVCYGGVSLAVYMHGITKELYKLVRAARAFDAAFDAAADTAALVNPFAAAQAGGEYDTEHAYFAALTALAQAGTPVTAVVDLIAGTSAGGINGVCLARALAHSRSMNNFLELWISKGDLDVLLTSHGAGFTHEQRMLCKLAVAITKLVRHPGQTGAPLNGDLMAQLLYGALSGMQAVPGAPPTLVRPEGSLDLMVTTTDMYGFDVAVPVGTGGISHTDRSYRQLLRFSFEAGQSDELGDDFIPALAFSARATSSFPGAFPPVSLDSFSAALQSLSPAVPVRADLITERFVYGEGYGATPAHSWFIDGGVLDNGPFDHVIDAIAAKPAQTQTAREIVYIEPDPGLPPAMVAGSPPQPSWFKTVLASRATIPWHEPLVGALGQLRDMNSMIAEVGCITEAQMGSVLQLLTRAGTPADSSYDAMVGQADRVRAEAATAAGLGYPTYGRLRAEAVAETIGAAIGARLGYPLQSNQASFATDVLSAWARGQQAWLDQDPALLENALGPVDLPFRERRAQFMLQGINALFASAGEHPKPAREDLGQLKKACWDLIGSIRAMAGQAAAGVGGELGVLGPELLAGATDLGDPQQYATVHAAELSALFSAYTAQLQGMSVGSSRALWEQFQAITRQWDAGIRDQLASRYLAFPVWDALIFPMIALARLPQLSPIGVTRFSPLDATALKPVDAQGNAVHGKLKGTALGHFGGFFKKQWRENDYLWGRLDGAELILRLLGREAPEPTGTAAGADLRTPLKDALTAILTTEKETLPDISAVMSQLVKQVEALPASRTIS